MNRISKKAKNSAVAFTKKLVIAAFCPLIFIACQKEMVAPDHDKPIANTAVAAGIISQREITKTRVQLLQANAESIAVSLRWTDFPCNPGETQDIRIEAAIAGTQFNGWVEIGSSTKSSADFTVKEFNRQIRQLFVTGFAEDIILRVKNNREGAEPQYSFGAPMQVTTYQPTIDHDNSKIIRVPGNFENWKIESAPKIVSVKSDGEYEGFINFTSNHSQFLLVKQDLSWKTLSTFYDIGNSKIGFGGKIFYLPGTEGIYKFNVSTNTNKWSCTKINSFGITGTALTTQADKDQEMIFNSSNNTWEITGNFKNGNFIFRANNTNSIVFGHNANSESGIADYNGAKIDITKAGNYTIRLSLLVAGNYTYSIQRNV
jgi:hypothetical protein